MCELYIVNLMPDYVFTTIIICVDYTGLPWSCMNSPWILYVFLIGMVWEINKSVMFIFERSLPMFAVQHRFDA